MRKDDVEQEHRAERAAATLLGDEFGLGDNIGVAWVRYSRTGGVLGLGRDLVRRRFCWYADGVVQTHPDRPTKVLRWAAVDSVTLTFNDADERFNGLSCCRPGSRPR
jgi:hypothetical protein